MSATVRALVTGAASGIGQATAQRLAADAHARGGRAEVLVVDVNGDGLERVAQELSAAGAVARPLVVDLAQADAGDVAVAAAIDAFGGLDAVVSNAGIRGHGRLLDVSPDDYERMFAINARAAWLLARAASPYLVDSRGAFVAVGSIATVEPAALEGAYAPAKAALAMMIRQLAHEWGPDGVRANCVSPGATHTGMSRAAFAAPELKAAYERQIPLRRIAEPADVAAVICFLLSPEAAYVTGQNLLVDGGMQTSLLAMVRAALTG